METRSKSFLHWQLAAASQDFPVVDERTVFQFFFLRNQETGNNKYKE